MTETLLITFLDGLARGGLYFLFVIGIVLTFGTMGIINFTHGSFLILGGENLSQEGKKSYFAIIPADVRYDENLCAHSKLLYGEITALCNEKGYCWASNEYFADLYHVSIRTIQRYINNLSREGYIDINLIKNTQRQIYLKSSNMTKLSPPP